MLIAAWLAAPTSHAQNAADLPTPTWRITATDQAITVHANNVPADALPPSKRQQTWTLWAAPVWSMAEAAPATKPGPVAIHEGTWPKRPLRVNRHQQGLDLAFCQFFWLPTQPANDDLTTPPNANNSPLAPTWVTAIRSQRKSEPVVWPKSIKGVSCPVLFDDLTDLGVAHVHHNINLNNILDDGLPLIQTADTPNTNRRSNQANQDLHAPDGVDPEYAIQVGPWWVRMRPTAVQALDRDLKQLSDRNINTVAVLLAYFDPNHPTALTHPNADLQHAPNKLAAFNLSNEDSVTRYLGVLMYLSKRYSQPGKPHGQIGGWILGNEVDSHWEWHNMGPAPLPVLAEHHAKELRLAHLALASQQTDPRLFLSLTHSWTRPNTPNANHHVPAKSLLESINAIHKREGDVPWGIAYHPYPQNLFEPRYWLDNLAVNDPNSPMVTFNNLAVLPEALQQPPLLHNHAPRRIILSEQGFHTPTVNGPDGQPDPAAGEALQAAIYAASFHKVSRLPGIDAYILHRHVDHLAEGGLKLGLWSANTSPPPGSNPYSTPLAKKAIWHTFQAMDTPNADHFYQQAQQTLGPTTWQQASTPGNEKTR